MWLSLSEISEAIILDILGLPGLAGLLTKTQKGQTLRTWHQDAFFLLNYKVNMHWLM